MKKQINPSIKAHLIRSAFYVLLLLALCVIPFALAQRNTTRPKMASKGRHATTVAASQSSNDVVSAKTANAGRAKKGKIQAPSTNFTTTFGRGPQSAALHKRPAAPRMPPPIAGLNASDDASADGNVIETHEHKGEFKEW